MGRTAAFKKQTNLAGSTIISYYVKVSGVRKGCVVWPVCARAFHGIGETIGTVYLFFSIENKNLS